VLDKSGVQWLVLVSFDNVRDDGVRELDKVLLGFGRRFQDFVEVRVGRAYSKIYKTRVRKGGRVFEADQKEKMPRALLGVRSPFAVADPKSSVAL
jgi:hypothetical protein